MNNIKPTVEIRSVSKRFGKFQALDDVSLSVGKGLFVTLLGPSGCGKSTLLRSIVGFCEPDQGNILIDGQDITKHPTHNRPAKMVFQDYALFPHMDVQTNIGFGCEMLGMNKTAINRRCQDLLELIQLPDIGGRYPDALSGGQRQRVALARALAPDPAVLLLDEPLGALDQQLRLQMQKELKHIQRQTQKTFIFVTHDQQEAMSMSDQVAVMNAGRIEQIGPPEDIYANPATLYVARFVGAANVFEGRVSELDDTGLLIEVADANWRLPLSRVTSLKKPEVGDVVSIVVRPEDLSSEPSRQKKQIKISGKLMERTYLGDRVHLELITHDGLTIFVDAHPATATETDTVILNFDPDCAAIITTHYKI